MAKIFASLKDNDVSLFVHTSDALKGPNQIKLVKHFCSTKLKHAVKVAELY